MKRAGVYWNRLNSLCKQRNQSGTYVYNCSVAAGDFVDDSTLFSGMRSYKDGMSYGSNKPSAWALHPYHTMHLSPADAEARIARFFTAIGSGPNLWLTEGGGRVYLYGSVRAKTDLCNLMKFPTFDSRITRLYQYQLVGPSVSADDGKDPHGSVNPNDKFDSALIENDHYADGHDALNKRNLYDVFRYYSAASGTPPC